MTAIAIHLDGGIIQSVGLIEGEPIDVLIIDYDVDGMDPDDLTEVPQSPNTSQEAFIHIMETEMWPDDVTTRWVKQQLEEKE